MIRYLCNVAVCKYTFTIFLSQFGKYLLFHPDPLPYLLKDRAAEKQHKFVMLTSHQKASKEQLLKGSKVHVTAGVKPEPQQMKDIIKCAGGEVRFCVNSVFVYMGN